MRTLAREMTKKMPDWFDPMVDAQYVRAVLISIQSSVTCNERELIWTFSLVDEADFLLGIPLCKVSKYHTVEQRIQLCRELFKANIPCDGSMMGLAELIGRHFRLEILWNNQTPRITFIEMA